MNLRNYSGPYSIGLDMGTGSVGWAVTDGRGKLLHFKEQPTWGTAYLIARNLRPKLASIAVSAVDTCVAVGVSICCRLSSWTR